MTLDTRTATHPDGGFARTLVMACVAGVVALAVLGIGQAASAIGLTDVAAAEDAHRCAEVELGAVRGELEGALARAHLARCRLEEGAFDGALEAWRAIEPRHLEVTRQLAWWPEIEGRLLLHDGDADAAVAVFEGLIEAAERDPTSLESRGRFTYYLSLARAAAGDAAGARRAAMQLSRRYPGSVYASRVALELLDDPPTGAERVTVAGAALAGRHYAAAEALYTLAACDGATTCAPLDAVTSGDATRYEAAYQLGWMLYRYRREFVARAIPWLETVAARPGAHRADAAWALAMAVMRMDRNEEARRAWQRFAEAHPRDDRVSDAAWHTAWLLLDAGDHEGAIAAYRDVVARDEDRRSAARRWLAWSYFRADRCPEARAEWRRLEDRGGAWWEGQALYWQGVCFEREGDAEAAAVRWREVRERWPLTWYALLASRRLGAPFVDGLDERPAPDATRVELDARLAPLLAIADAGLRDEARLIAAHDPRYTAASWDSDPRQAEAFALRVTADVDDWLQWRWRAREVLDRAPGDVATLRQWQLAWPRFYEPVVEREAASAEIPPSLVWAIMQKESNYDPMALSISDAMGLMQVIPQTASQISQRLDESYVDGMLFEPRHAIRYGAWYLGALSHKFDGQLPLAIGSYNAGPLAMETWVDRYGDERLDVFVESIPWVQARDYIKRVVGFTVSYEVASGDARRLASPTLGGILPERVERGWRDNVRF